MTREHPTMGKSLFRYFRSLPFPVVPASGRWKRTPPGRRVAGSPVPRLLALLLAPLCGQVATASAATLQVEIQPSMNGAPLALDSLRYRTFANESFSVTRLSFLLSRFALERTDGGWLEITNRFAWLDATARRVSFRLDDAPAGTFRSLRFEVGLDEADNNADPALRPADHPLNPNLNGLHWSWQGGYIFLALEGMFRGTNQELRGYAYHLARSPNRTRITLAAPLDLRSAAALTLDFDLAALLNAPRPLSFGRDGSATHSREGDPVAGALVANLPGAFRVRRIAAPPAGAAEGSVKPKYLPAKFTPYRFTMNAHFPVPDLPRDNPLTGERVTLGGALFGETALSRDGTVSCASCHSGAAFSDARRFSAGVEGRTGTRNAMPLQNLAWKSSFFWDGRAPSLRAQALMPIEDHAEMDESLTNACAKLARAGGASLKAPQTQTNAPADYPALFEAAFGSAEITPEKIGLALESFVLTLLSGHSKFDRAMRGEARLSDEERRGAELFMTEYDPRTGQFGADCFHCHGGPLFTDHQFHNNGLDADVPRTLLSARQTESRTGGSAPRDFGRERVTGRAADRGKFSTPSLRNVALTAPYMHDGRFATLEDVVNHYRRGMQRSATLDPNLAKHPDGGVPLTDGDARALVAFLRSLSDEPPERPGGAR